jgi:hypothetical protein
MAFARICLLNNLSWPTDCSCEERRIGIAALLVHEATHGELYKTIRIPHRGDIMNQIEQICEDEQLRTINRLENAQKSS